MPQPTPYERLTSFTDHSTSFPSTPQPGVGLDGEFDAIKLTTDDIRTNLALIQRDDGKLADGVVTVDAVSAELLDQIGDAAAGPFATQAAASAAASAASAASASAAANAANDDAASAATSKTDAAASSAAADASEAAAAASAASAAATAATVAPIDDAIADDDPGATAKTRSAAKVGELIAAKGPLEFGAVGDGVTDDYTALQAWLDHGGDLFLPALHFYSSQALKVRKQVRVRGAGYGFDARIAGGYAAMPGSRIRFPALPAGTKCFDVQPQTTITDVATVLADVTAAFTQEGAYGSTFADFALIGPNTGSADGFYDRTLIQVDNVFVVQFGGKGFDISASSDTPDGISEYGNASTSSLRNCVALENGGHGFHLRGRDANTILVDNCNAHNNGGRGFLDESLLGNTYLKCHAAGNVGGSYEASGAVSESKFDNCYVEGDIYAGAEIGGLNKIVGGGLKGANVSPDYPPWAVGGNLMDVHEVRYQWGWTDPAAITGYGRQFRSTINGMVIQGEGGTYDVSLYNKSGQAALRIPTGTQIVYAEGALSGNGVTTRDGNLKRSDGNVILASPVAGETSFFATGTGIYRWYNSVNSQHTSADNAGNWNFSGNLNLTAANPTINLNGSSYGQILFFEGGVGISQFLATAGVQYISADTFIIRDKATLADTRMTITGAGLNLGAGKVFKIGGTQVVGAQGAAVADAVAAVAAPTKAEFDALVTQVNALLARMRAHGLIAT